VADRDDGGESAVTQEQVAGRHVEQCLLVQQAEIAARRSGTLRPHLPGFISAAVHRSTDGTRVINHLQWESVEHLAAMQRSPEFPAIAVRFAGLIEFEPHQCEIAPHVWLIAAQ
jgi:quinol monooxygenase YgiN